MEVNIDIDQTRGISTREARMVVNIVGDPNPENPNHEMGHPIDKEVSSQINSYLIHRARTSSKVS